MGALTLTGAALSGCGDTTPAVNVGGPALPSSAPAPAAPAAIRSTPASIRIPTIAVSAPVGSLGFNEAEQTVEVPSKPAHTGWYRHGPAPGENGSAVILGHVDSHAGPAVFARLKDLRRGDKITVTMSDGSTARYTVKKVATYPNAAFPAQRVYGATGPSTLNLVTCGGRYDKAKGYQANVVVYTALTAPRPA